MLGAEARMATIKVPRNTQVRDLIEALRPYRKGRHRQGAIDDVRRARQGRGEEIGKNFEYSIQSAFNQHNKDSSVWRNEGANPRNALFYFPGARGWWAVDLERAEEWIAENPSISDIHLGDIHLGEVPDDFSF
jgi:hypothetical protein